VRLTLFAWYTTTSWPARHRRPIFPSRLKEKHSRGTTGDGIPATFRRHNLKFDERFGDELLNNNIAPASIVYHIWDNKIKTDKLKRVVTSLILNNTGMVERSTLSNSAPIVI
jgi:hypothetical protein